jgi:hypothetical protein
MNQDDFKDAAIPFYNFYSEYEQYARMFDIARPRPLMPSTDTKAKKNLNKNRLSAKLRKKHKKAARNR